MVENPYICVGYPGNFVTRAQKSPLDRGGQGGFLLPLRARSYLSSAATVMRLFTAAWAAANRAMGTRNGEQLT